jgi:hypothetical protein
MGDDPGRKMDYRLIVEPLDIRERWAIGEYAEQYQGIHCHPLSHEGWQLVPYDSERFIATTKAEAAAKAQKWAMITTGIIVDKTWLQVTLEGDGVYTQELRIP